MLFDYVPKAVVPVAGPKIRTDTGVLSCDAADKSFHDQVATLEAGITFLQQLLPGRSMTTGTACNPPDLLRALSMERSRSGKIITEGMTSCCSVQIENMCVQHMAKEQHYVSFKQIPAEHADMLVLPQFLNCCNEAEWLGIVPAEARCILQASF